jgi:hypothetical protein
MAVSSSFGHSIALDRKKLLTVAQYSACPPVFGCAIDISIYNNIFILRSDIG